MAQPQANGTTPPAAASWLDLTSSIPLSPNDRATAMMAYDPIDGYVVLFGGDNLTTPSFGDTWVYAATQWSQLNPGSSPPSRWIASMAWDGADGYVLLFGGYSGATMFNDTWSFVHGAWTNITPIGPSPSPRWRALMAYDAADGYVLLFSGTRLTGSTTPFTDTWKFVAGAWTNITKNVTGSPPGRYRATMTYDSNDSYVLMFGGCTNSACPPADTATWTYHNLTWKQSSSTAHPSARVYPMMTDDPGMGYVVLFGGAASTTSGAMADTWAYAGGNWTNLSSQISSEPKHRGFEMMTWDGADRYVLLFGGENPFTNSYLGDTWSYGPAIISTLAATPATVDLGGNVTLNTTAIAASSVLSYNYTTLPAGCATANLSVLVCVPTATGSFPIIVNVSDPAGAYTTSTVSIQVNADPQITGFTVSPATVTVGGQTNFTAQVSFGTTPYSYRYSTLPSGCFTGNTPSLSCVPSAAATPGSYTVGLNVTDGARFTISGTVRLSVNALPSVTQFTVTPATSDVGVEMNFTSQVAGGTAPLSYSYTGLPNGCIGSNLRILPCTPTQFGSGVTQVTVSDAFGKTSTATTSFLVNPRPSVDSFAITPASLDLGGTITLWTNASGGTGTLQYAYSGLPSGCAPTPGPKVTCAVGAPGTFTVTVTVTDAIGVVGTATAPLTVTDRPSISSFTATPATVEVGAAINFTVVAVGGAAPLSYAYSDLPRGCTSHNAPSLSCVVTAQGYTSTMVTVTDRLGDTATQFAPVTINAAPGISSFVATPSSITVGSSTVFAVTVSAGESPYAFAYHSLPPGCATADTAQLSCTPTTTGTFLVQVKVNDSLGVSANSTTTLTVTSTSASGFLGLSATTAYVLIGVIAAVVAIAVAVLLLRRSRAKTPAPEPTAEESAGAPEDASWQEPEGPQ